MNDFRRYLLLLSFAAGSPILHAAPQSANTSLLPPLESFFAESERFAESLSKDGTQVAYLGPDSTGTNRLWVVGTEPSDAPVQISAADGPAVAAYFWIGDASLLWQACESSGRVRFFIQDAPASLMREILPDERRIIRLEGVADTETPSMLIGLSDGPAAFPDLYRVKLKGQGMPELVSANIHNHIITWAWDDSGTPVAGLRWTDDGAKELLSLRDGAGTVLFRAEPADDARLLFATANGSQVLVLTNKDTDLTHLGSIDLSTGTKTVIASDPLGRSDLDQVVADAKGNIHAVGLTDETIRWQARETAFGKLLETLDRLPDTSGMSCLGFDADRKRCLLKRSSPRDPGTVYLYDISSNTLRFLWRDRPELDRATLCETSAFDYTARDGTKIPAYLTVPRVSKPPWPLVVFPHGGPRMRTSPRFDGRVQFLASRGYAVLQPNFRGSRGYGKAFMNAGDLQWGKGVMQTDVTDGLDHLVRAGTVDPHRVAIFGGSYGGYAALAGLAFTPDLYAAGICLFGISDLPAYAAYAPVECQAYTGDAVRRLGDPATQVGRELLRDTSPVNYAAAFKAPLLIYHGARDNLIPVAHARRMVAELERYGKRVDYLLAPEEAHGFAHPESEMAVYRAIELFLHTYLGGKVGPAPAKPVSRILKEFRTAGRTDDFDVRGAPSPVRKHLVE